MITITDQLFLSLGLPLDRKLSNLVLNGSTIKVESISEYLERVDTYSRYLGMEVNIIQPSGEYNIAFFQNNCIAGNFVIVKYKFAQNISDSGFILTSESGGGGHIIRDQSSAFPSQPNLTFKGNVSISDNPSLSSTEIEILGLTEDQEQILSNAESHVDGTSETKHKAEQIYVEGLSKDLEQAIVDGDIGGGVTSHPALTDKDSEEAFQHIELADKTKIVGLIDKIDPVLGVPTKFLNEKGDFVPVATTAIGVQGRDFFARSINSDIVGYKTLSNDAGSSESIVSITARSSDGIVWGDKYLTDSFVDGKTIRSAAWGFDYWRLVNSAVGVSRKHLRVFIYRGGVEIDILTLQSPEIDETEFTERQISYVFQEVVLQPNDRLGIQEGFSTTHATNITFQYIIGDGRGWLMRIPIDLEHKDLVDKNGEAAFQHVSSTEKTNLTAHINGADESKHESNQIINTDALSNLGTGTNAKVSAILSALNVKLASLVDISEIDVTDINVGEKKIVVAIKGSGGMAEFGGAIGLLDMIANPGVESGLAETAAWVADEITLTGNNLQGQLGENSQIFPGVFDFFVCISHITGTTTSNGSATWRRYRSMDCLNIAVSQHATIIGQLETESGWNSLAQYKVIAAKSKRGTWFRRTTGGYLYMCIDDSNGWTRVGTPPTVDMEITSVSHPILTASLTAHNWGTGFYTQGGSDEPAGQGQKWWDETNNRVYERNMNGKWAKTFG